MDVEPRLGAGAVAHSALLDHLVLGPHVRANGVHTDAEQPARPNAALRLRDVRMRLSPRPVLEHLDADNRVELLAVRQRGEITVHQLRAGDARP